MNRSGGAENLKNVYYCFPDHLKGVVYLFHGAGEAAPPVRTLRLYPNPASGTVVLDLPDADHAVSIFNQAGQRIRSYSRLNGSNAIAIDDLDAGVYWIRTVGKKSAGVGKLVKGGGAGR